MKKIIIRPEEIRDRKRVEQLTKAAFYREERIEKLGMGCNEHYLVHVLRNSIGIEELNFVAEIDGKVVGHVIYSRGKIEKDSGGEKEVISFGPLSVDPEYQKKGVGSALMEFSIGKAKELGYGAIIIFGHPTYYPRFGFLEGKDFGVRTSGDENFPAFMAMELIEGDLKGAEGRYIEGDVFDEEKIKEKALEYDKKYFG